MNTDHLPAASAEGIAKELDNWAQMQDGFGFYAALATEAAVRLRRHDERMLEVVQERDELQRQLTEYMTVDCADPVGQLDKALAKAEILEQERDGLVRSVSQYQGDNDQLREQLAHMTGTINETTARLRGADSQNQALSEDLAWHRRRLQELSELIYLRDDQVHDLERDRARLQVMVDVLGDALVRARGGG